MNRKDYFMLQEAYSKLGLISEEPARMQEVGDDVSPEQRAVNSQATLQSLKNRRAQDVADQAKGKGSTQNITNAYDAYLKMIDQAEKNPSQENLNALEAAHQAWVNSVSDKKYMDAAIVNDIR